MNRFTNLRLSMFCKYNGTEGSHQGTMPCLIGRAGEIQSFGPALSFAYKQFANLNCVEIPAIQRAQIQMALEYTVGVDRIMDENRCNFVFERTVYEEFKTQGWGFLILYNALGFYFSEIARPAMKLFNMTVKAHMVGHCILQGRWVNPRLGWCYSGEHLMFYSRRILASCTKHNGPAAAVSMFFRKYRAGMHLLLARQRAVRS